jgi:hypothetical protein
MTEYEIADLAFSKQEGLMEMVGLLQTQTGNMTTVTTLYISMLFGYLLVAYFIGAALTRAQSVILTILYLLTISLNRGSFLSLQLVGQELSKVFIEMAPDASPVFVFTDAGIVFSTALFVATIAGSLYFMWRVRHPGTE